MRAFFILLFYGMALLSFSQNKQVLYNFANIPQNLLQNPALDADYKYHMGIPLLSANYASAGITGFNLLDIFATDTQDVTTTLNRVANQLTAKDYATVNTQIELFNAGFRYKNYYFNFGSYQEIDGISYFPEDSFSLATSGNANAINRVFNASDIAYKLDAIHVLHLGFSKKVSPNFSFGARFKIYASLANLESTNNYGTFTTSETAVNIYQSAFNNVNLNFRTSGIIADNQYVTSPKHYLKNALLGGNRGLGFDIGFNYKLSPQLHFSASLLDIGFINHKKNVKTTTIKGNFILDGLLLDFNTDTNYWEEVTLQINDEIPTTINNTSYVSWRPTKFNAAVRYGFGKTQPKFCYDNTVKDSYTNAFGLQLFSMFRPQHQQFAITGFYERALTTNLRSKLTYTVNSFSNTNIGFGLSTQLYKFNVYGMVDNLLALSDLSSAHTLSLQFGINLVFN